MKDISKSLVPNLWIELENKHAAIALKELEARKQSGMPITPEWLDALEKEHQALALQEIKRRKSR